MPNSIQNSTYSIALIVIFVTASSIIANELPTFLRQSRGVATVKGAVKDSNGSVIVLPQPTIVFKQTEEIKRVGVNEHGNYEVSLPPGVYTVTTEIPGFYPSRRAQFRLVPGNTVIINLIPKPRYLARGTTISLEESVDTPGPKPKFNSFQVPGGGLRMLIEFEKRRGANSNIEYERAVLTYDSYTIYADKLFFSKRRLQLKASGKPVVIEDGTQRVEVKQAVMTFKGGKPILDLIK